VYAGLLVLALGCALAACGPPAPGARTAGPAAAPPAAHASRLYVALGASDAFGIGTDDPDRQNWPTVLAGELGGSVRLDNLGFPGATVAQARQIELPVALSSHPDLVTVWLAVNDFADGVALDAYTAQLTALLDALRHGTHARVFVADLPDLSLLPFFSAEDGASLRTIVQRWNGAIARVCAAEGDHLVDLARWDGDLAQHPEYISSDGLHPSTEGAARLADIFALAIRQAGAA
jgi:lysophospholipase L1-like esterase